MTTKRNAIQKATPQSSTEGIEVEITLSEWAMIAVTAFTGLALGPIALLPGSVLVGMWLYRAAPDVMRASGAGQWVQRATAHLLPGRTEGDEEFPTTPLIVPRQPVYDKPVQVRRGDTQPSLAAVVQHRPPPAASLLHRETPMLSRDDAAYFVCFGHDAHGRRVYAPLRHGIIANSTGGGKTNLLDIIVGQLVAAGVEVWAGSPKYIPIDPSDGFLRHVIYDAIPPAQRAMSKDALLPWLLAAAAAVEDRYARMQAEPGWFPTTMVVVLDELKAYLRMLGKRKDQRGSLIADQVNDAIQVLLTLGRECNVTLMFTSQDGYCGAIEMTRGEIGNLGFRLVHPSLDDNSKKNLLPQSATVGGALGTYDWYCAVGNDVRVVSIPRASQQMLMDWGLTSATVQEPRPTATPLRTLVTPPPWQRATRGQTGQRSSTHQPDPQNQASTRP
jgi:hypothetical protein